MIRQTRSRPFLECSGTKMVTARRGAQPMLDARRSAIAMRSSKSTFIGTAGQYGRGRWNAGRVSLSCRHRISSLSHALISVALAGLRQPRSCCALTAPTTMALESSESQRIERSRRFLLLRSCGATNVLMFAHRLSSAGGLRRFLPTRSYSTKATCGQNRESFFFCDSVLRTIVYPGFPRSIA